MIWRAKFPRAHYSKLTMNSTRIGGALPVSPEYYSANGMKNFILLKGGQNDEGQGSVCSLTPC